VAAGRASWCSCRDRPNAAKRRPRRAFGAEDELLIQGSTDGPIYAAEDRLEWLLPLLERTPIEVATALPHVPLDHTPLPALVRFALTAWGEYWPALALGWLEAGWPPRDVLDVLADMKESQAIPQPLRHRALRLWHRATHT
jgi:hypothetical protein